MAQSRPKKKILDALEALSDDGSNEASSSASEEPEEAPQQQPAKKQKISLEDLQKQGYNSGPSVLYMKVPEEEGQQNWSWGDGRAQKSKEGDQESLQERRQTHEAATSAAEEGARLALKAAEHAAKLRQDALKEREELKKKNQLTFSQKEKKKRDAGQQSRGKSTVEEEKRIARNFGVYSGFD